jgi:hypothetical protein
LVLISLACIGISLWFLFDGLVTYPNQRMRALEYQKLNEEERLDEWPELARERGWPTEDPGEPKEEADIYVQRVIAALACIPGVLYAIFYFRARGRWIEVTETGLRSSWRQEFGFDQIVSLDKKLWRSKGIARVNYQQEGRKRRLTLDDWKYDAEPTRSILRTVESHIDPGQIVNGLPEPILQDESHEDDSTREVEGN